MAEAEIEMLEILIQVIEQNPGLFSLEVHKAVDGLKEALIRYKVVMG